VPIMADANEIAAQSAEGAERKITFSRDYSVALPRGERAYMIPASEWERLKRMVSRIVPAKEWFLVAASICIGIFVSAVFALIGFSASWNSVPMWAKAIASSAAVCALVLSIGLFYLDTQQRGDIKESTNEVTSEMEEIEKACRAAEADDDPGVHA